MTFRPNDITKDHILAAIKKIEEEQVQLIPSTKYDVLIDGKKYPPKEVMRYAHEQLDGEKRWDYPGGPQTFRFLAKHGFVVQPKEVAENPVGLIVQQYKERITNLGLNDELYKWELLGRFQGQPNLEESDFGNHFRSIDYSNLMYQISKAVLRHLAKDRPEPLRNALRILFDETQPLPERLRESRNAIDAAYREIEPVKSTHFDERTQSVLLTFHDPGTFTFYKDSFYRKFCSILGVPTRTAGEKYVHFLELVELFIDEHLKENSELLSLVDSYLNPNCYKDPGRTILAQDILYQILEKPADGETGYWVFQANPELYDLSEGLRTGLIENWTVSAHKDKIKVGDKIILWSTGRQAGCYALAKVTEEPRLIGDLPDAHLWNVEDHNTLKAGIEVTHNLVETPILNDVVRKTHGLENLKAGTQGTNFTATKEQYDILKSLAEGRGQPGSTVGPVTLRPKNIILFGPPGTGKTFNSIELAVEIADGFIDRSDHRKNKFRFDELRQEGLVEFVTFHQNYSYEDFMVGIRPDVDNENLRFQSQKGTFYRIAKRARDNYEESLAGKERRSFDEVLSEILEPLERNEEIPIEMASGISFRITEVSEKSISFTKHSGGTAHTLSISTLRDVAEGVRDVPGGLNSYYNPLVKLIQMKRETTKAVEGSKNFVLIIDEINRANISRVFGELITLLEDDKRLGAENELRTTLPNGERDFAVPPNLYVVGTMNTADKSIALIDVALRRRFEFVGYYPDVNLLTNPEKQKLLLDINAKVYERKKSPDYLVGHAYFMTEKSITEILQNKVIPLLTEYFSGKIDQVETIFADSDWEVWYDSSTYKWNIEEKRNHVAV